MGLTETTANLVLLGLTVVAVIASFGWGCLVDRLGPKRTLMIVLASWAVGLVVGGVSLGIAGRARARRCSSSPGRSSAAASAASRSPTGCS